MRNYIKADIKRLYQRVPRMVLLILLTVIYTMMTWPSKDTTAVEAFQGLSLTLVALPIILGVLELLFVFGDDMHAKTAQIAIGRGLKRERIIFSKILEVMLVIFFDLLLINLAAVLAIAIKTSGLKGVPLGDLLITNFIIWLTIVVHIILVSFIMFYAQNINLSLILYIILASGLIPKALEMGSSFLKISRFHLQTYTTTSMLNILQARLMLGNVPLLSVIGLIVYIVLFLFLAIFLYKKRELDF